MARNKTQFRAAAVSSPPTRHGQTSSAPSRWPTASLCALNVRSPSCARLCEGRVEGGGRERGEPESGKHEDYSVPTHAKPPSTQTEHSSHIPLPIDLLRTFASSCPRVRPWTIESSSATSARQTLICLSRHPYDLYCLLRAFKPQIPHSKPPILNIPKQHHLSSRAVQLCSSTPRRMC